MSHLKAVSDCSRVWHRFSRIINGQKKNFRWERLKDHRYEEFLDLKMKYYVSRELIHKVAGISNSSRAKEEYREILRNMYKGPQFYTFVCYDDDGTDEMIGFGSMKLVNKGDHYSYFEDAETPEVKKYFNTMKQLDEICHVPNVLEKLNKNQIYDDAGLTVIPKYSGYSITNDILLVSYLVAKAHKVPLLGAWLTSPAMQKAVKNAHSRLFCNIPPELLEKILRIPVYQTTIGYYVINIGSER